MSKADLHVKLAGGQKVVGGYSLQPYNLGNLSTQTLNPLLGNYQYGTNVGSFTLAAPTVDCAIDILITNSGTAGSVVLSGFTVGASTGDPLTTTNGSKFILSIRRINGTSTYVVKALQ